MKEGEQALLARRDKSTLVLFDNHQQKLSYEANTLYSLDYLRPGRVNNIVDVLCFCEQEATKVMLDISQKTN